MQSSEGDDDGAETYSYFLPQGLGLLDDQDEVFESGRSNEAGRLSKPQPASRGRLPHSSRFADEFVPAANRPLLQTRTIFPKEYNSPSPLSSFSSNPGYPNESKSSSGLYTYSPRLNPAFPGPSSLDSPQNDRLNVNDPPLFSQRSVLASLGLGLAGSPRPIVDDEESNKGNEIVHPRLSSPLLDGVKPNRSLPHLATKRASSPKAKHTSAQAKKFQGAMRGGKSKQHGPRSMKPSSISREPNVIQVVPQPTIVQSKTTWAKVGAAKPGFTKSFERPAGSQATNAALPVPYSGAHSHVGKKSNRGENKQREPKHAPAVGTGKPGKDAGQSAIPVKPERRSSVSRSSTKDARKNKAGQPGKSVGQSQSDPALHEDPKARPLKANSKPSERPATSKQRKRRVTEVHEPFEVEKAPSPRPTSPSPSQSSQSSVPPDHRRSPLLDDSVPKLTPTPTGKKSKKKKKKKQKADTVDASETRSDDGNEGEGGEGGAEALHPGDNNAEYIPYEQEPAGIASVDEDSTRHANHDDQPPYEKPRTSSTQSDQSALRRRNKKIKPKPQVAKPVTPKPEHTSDISGDAEPNTLQKVVSSLPQMPQVSFDLDLKPVSRKAAAKFWVLVMLVVNLVAQLFSKIALCAAKVHVKAAHVLAADHHLAFSFSFLYVFPWLVHSMVYWAPPWVAPCLFYAFLMQVFCTQGPPVLVALFRCLLPLLFLTESIAHHSCLLHLNGAERLVVAFVLSSFKTQEFFRPAFLLVLSIEIIASFLLGHYMMVHWVVFVCSLLAIRPVSATDPSLSARSASLASKQGFVGSVTQQVSQPAEWQDKSLPPISAPITEPKQDSSVLTPTNAKTRRKPKNRRNHRGH